MKLANEWSQMCSSINSRQLIILLHPCFLFHAAYKHDIKDLMLPFMFSMFTVQILHTWCSLLLATLISIKSLYRSILYCIYFIVLTGKNTSAVTKYMYIFPAHYWLISQFYLSTFLKVHAYRYHDNAIIW